MPASSDAKLPIVDDSPLQVRPEQQQQQWREQTISPTNIRLRRPSHAASLALDAVLASTDPTTAVSSLSRQQQQQQQQQQHPPFRVVLGIGTGRSGTKSLNELFVSQPQCIHSEHEMIVPRSPPTNDNNNNNNNNRRGKEEKGEGNQKMQRKKKKGSWGSDRRLEWDSPRQARGTKNRTEKEAAQWRVGRLLEQRRVFVRWVNAEKNGQPSSPRTRTARKLGAKGWRDHNKNRSRNRSDPDDTEDVSVMVTTRALHNSAGSDTIPTGNNSRPEDEKCSHKEPPASVVQRRRCDDDADTDDAVVVVAAVSSSALAYVHEYVALDPSVRIAVVTRPTEDVLHSFLTKTKGRNHWQRYDEDNRIQDKTWDNQFPYMTDQECGMMKNRKHPHHQHHYPMCSSSSSSSSTTSSIRRKRPDKAAAINAYCDLYGTVTQDLVRLYPNNVRIFNMSEILNDKIKQDRMLQWCGFHNPLIDTSIRLNKAIRRRKDTTTVHK